MKFLVYALVSGHLCDFTSNFQKNSFSLHKQGLGRVSGFIDIDKINPDAYPALVADLSAGEQGIIALAFGEPYDLDCLCGTFISAW